jgi:hypothetical protein
MSRKLQWFGADEAHADEAHVGEVAVRREEGERQSLLRKTHALDVGLEYLYFGPNKLRLPTTTRGRGRGPATTVLHITGFQPEEKDELTPHFAVRCRLHRPSLAMFVSTVSL